MNRPSRPWLYLVTNRLLVAPDAPTLHAEVLALEGWLDEALAADLDVIQIRERDLDARVLLELVRRVVARRGSGRPHVILNDRADVAIAADADGVHLRADGPSVPDVRALSRADWIVGRSVHTLDEIRAHASADYLLFGTVFAGGSKAAASPPQGLHAVEQATASSRVPIIAIGGITPGRGRAVIDAGAAGIAAIGAFVTLGPMRAAEAFRAALRDAGS